MTLTQLCWLSTAAYGLHILEEFTLNWKDWAASILHLRVEWDIFYLANSLVIVLGIVSAELAPSLPAFALAFPGLMLINATFFHVGAFLFTRGRFSPGLITAVLLFFPLGIASYRAAIRSQAVSSVGIFVSLLLGAAIMMTPIGLIKMKDKPYFKQPQ